MERRSGHQRGKPPDISKPHQKNLDSLVRQNSSATLNEIEKKSKNASAKIERKNSVTADAEIKMLTKRVKNSTTTNVSISNERRRSCSDEKHEHPNGGLVRYSKSKESLSNVKSSKKTKSPLTTNLQTKMRSLSIPSLQSVSSQSTIETFHVQLSEVYMKELSQKIKTELKAYYDNFHHMGCPILHTESTQQIDLSHCLQTLRRNTKGEFSKRPILLEDIFKSASKLNCGASSISPRILLEGSPGFGKTTLACQIGLDWSIGKQYLLSFDYVLVIQLRHLTGSIEEFLSKILNLENINAQVWPRILKRIQHQSLLILDGYDEMNKCTKNYIGPILRGSKYPEMTVLVTSRPDVGLLKNYLLEHYSGKSCSIPWDKIILLTGIDNENQKEFLERNLKSMTKANRVIKNITQEMNEEMKEIYKSPLFLKLIAFLIENNTIESVNSKTELYTNAVNFVIKHSLTQTGVIQKEEVVDIFYKGEKEPFYIYLLLKLGRLSLDALRQKKFYFSKEEIKKVSRNDERILKLGLLTKSIFYKQKMKEFYEPIHKSFIEFLSAYFLANMITSEKGSREDEFVQLICIMMEEEVKPMSGSLVYQFLGGILGRKVTVLFNALSHWSFKYYITRYREYFYHNYHFFYPILNILSEVSVTPDLLHSLLPFIPVKWEVKKHKDKSRFFVSILHSQLLSLGTQTNKVQWLCWHLDQEITLPENLSVRKLELDIWRNFEYSMKILEKVHIQCEELTCKFVIGFEDACWESFVKLMSNIEWKELNIVLDADVVSGIMINLHYEFTFGKWMDKTIHRICCDLVEKLNCETLHLIQDLVAKEKITGGLQIKIVWASEGHTNGTIKESDINNLFETAARSTQLKEFSFVNLWSDLNTIFNVNVFSTNCKQWKYLTFHNKVDFKIETKNQSSVLEVEEIELDRLQNVGKEISILALCKGIKRMKCTSELFKALTVKMPNQWLGYESVTELNLKIIEESYQPGQFNGLSQLINLSVLSLDLYWVKCNHDEEENNNDDEVFGKAISLNSSDAEVLLRILPKLSLKVLEFNGVGGWNVPFVKHITGGLLDISSNNNHKNNPSVNARTNDKFAISQKKKTKIHLNQFKIQFHEIVNEEMMDFITIFKKFFKLNVVQRISFLDPDESQVKLISSAFAFKEGYKIQIGVEGLNPDDTLKSKKEFYYNDTIMDNLNVELI